MSEEIKEYPFDVKFDESALKTFNDLIKEKGIRHFKLESDLYGILDVVSYEEYEKLQQKVEQLEKELNQEKEEYAGLHKVLNNKEEEFEKENYNNVVEISRLKRKVEQLENIRKEIKEYIEKQVVCCKNGDMLVELNVDDLLNILNKGE